MPALATVLVTLLSNPLATPAQAFNSDDVVSVELRPGWRTEQGTHMAALHITLADGWKTYWRAPGELGIPPRFDWSGSRNIAAVRLHWPRPVVFDQLGANSIGYDGELVLPMEFTLRDSDNDARLTTFIEIGVCETICVPVSLEISADLPRAGGKPDPKITAALADRPQPAGAAGLRHVSCGMEMIAEGIRMTAQLDMPRISQTETAVFELSDRSVWISDSQTERNGDVLTAQADFIPDRNGAFALDRSDLRITILGRDSAVELRGCPSN